MSQQEPPVHSIVEKQAANTPVAGQASNAGLRSLAVVAGICVLLVGLFFAALAGWVFQQYGERSSGGENSEQRTERLPGDHVDGQLAFRIEESRCGVDAVGVQPNRYEATGQYCVYLVRVRNAGNQPRVLLSTPQRAIGSDGKKYEPDVLASEAAGPDGRSNSFPDLLWSDQEATVALVYDMDPQVSIVSLEFHGFPWSKGVRVEL